MPLRPSSVNDSRCPVCGSYEIEGHDISIEGKQAWQNMTCNDCNSKWNDVYDFRGRDEYDYDESYTGISPDAYVSDELPCSIMFSHITKDDDPDHVYRNALYDQLVSVIRYLSDHTYGPMFASQMRNAVKTCTHLGTIPEGILVKSDWGQVNACLIRDEHEIQLSLINVVTGVPLATFLLIDERCAYLNPWIGLYDRIKNASVPYMQSIMQQADTLLRERTE